MAQQFGIEDVLRFAFSSSAVASDYENELSRFMETSKKTEYQIVNCYVDLCHVALEEGRPRPPLAEVSRQMHIADVQFVGRVIDTFSRAMGSS